MAMRNAALCVGLFAQASSYQLAVKDRSAGSFRNNSLCDPDQAMSLANRYNGNHGLPIANNLGGLGPMDGDESLHLVDVFPGSGRSIDLKITTDEHYQAKNTDVNGIVNGVYCQINTLSGTRNNHFTFQFLDSTTGESVSAPPFLMTFLDFDEGQLGSASESVTIRGFDKYYTIEDDTPELEIEELAEGQIRVSATEFGNKFDNPISAFQLTHNMKKRAISFEFSEVSEFFVSMQSGNSSSSKPGGRNIMFGGPTSLQCPEIPSCEGYACPSDHVLVPFAEYVTDTGAKACCLPRESCNTYICPTGHIHIKEASTTFCANHTCESSDSSTCCEEASPICHTNELVLGTLKVNNLAGKGPNKNASSKTMTFGNVFPRIGYEVDLIISAVSEYDPKEPTKNGLNGHFGAINQRTGETVQLEFAFVRADSGEAAQLDFLFSAYDLDTSKKGSTEYVKISGYNSYKIVQDAQVVAEPEGTHEGSFFGSSVGFDVDNPNDLYNLTETQLKRLVTFEFQNTSKFNMTFGTSAGGRGGRNLFFAGGSALYCDA